jgi:predicted SnoaL-like aldol condensation-catalyzing enzyme
MRTKNFNRNLLKISALSLAFMTFLLVACTEVPAIPTQEEAQAAVMEKLKAASAGWAAEDPMVFYNNAAENIVWIDDVGPSKRIVGKEALKAYLEGFKGAVPPHEHELFDFNFQFYGDVVIATYYYQGVMEGEKAPPWKAVSIFNYDDGEWSAILEHWTVVVAEPTEEPAEASED